MGHITGYDHEHEHKHEYEHDHGHDHAASASDPTTVRALISYMIHHNEHHSEELADLLDTLPESARKKLLIAIGTYEAANVELQQVLDELDRLE